VPHKHRNDGDQQRLAGVDNQDGPAKSAKPSLKLNPLGGGPGSGLRFVESRSEEVGLRASRARTTLLALAGAPNPFSRTPDKRECEEVAFSQPSPPLTRPICHRQERLAVYPHLCAFLAHDYVLLRGEYEAPAFCAGTEAEREL
jgi:hypothetical protein